jgi:glycosyltransferase involved in cell wall biosynthesis
MKLIIFERVLTHYRLKFYNYLIQNYDVEIIFLTKEIPNYKGFKTNEKLANFKIMKLKYTEVFGFEFYSFPFSILKSDNVIVSLLSFKSLPNIFYAIFRLLIGKKFYFWGHSKNFSKSSYLESFKNHIKGFSALLSSGVLAYTEKEKIRFQSYGLSSNKIIVLNNTINTDKILKIVDSISNKEILNIEIKYNLKGKLVIGLIGRLHKLRNTEFAINAILNLQYTHKNLVFLIIGEGEEYINLKNKYSTYENIIFVGAIEDEYLLAPLFHNIKFFINPGLVGLNIAHSMIYGKTTVVMKKKYHSPEIDFLIPEYNGILTENSLESFQNGISRLINDSDLLEKLSKNSFIYAKDNLSIDKMAHNFISILK